MVYSQPQLLSFLLSRYTIPGLSVVTVSHFIGFMLLSHCPFFMFLGQCFKFQTSPYASSSPECLQPSQCYPHDGLTSWNQFLLKCNYYHYGGGNIRVTSCFQMSKGNLWSWFSPCVSPRDQAQLFGLGGKPSLTAILPGPSYVFK